MATFALLSWPLIALFFFAKLGVARGLIWSVLVGYLFLPEAYVLDPPGLPPYNKSAAIAFGAALGVLVFRKAASQSQVHQPWSPFRILMVGLLALLFLSPVGTLFSNPESIVTGPVVRPGLTLSDLLAMSFSLITRFLPFILAARYLTAPEHHRELLMAVVILGVVYSFLALIEMIMSPQLNIWTYGYFQHQWLQHERGGAYRPLVYLRHGLWLGFFLFGVAMSAFVLIRSTNDKKVLYFITAIWILVVLLLSRNLGATALGLSFAPLILICSRRVQVRIAAYMAAIFFAYPVLLSSGFTPAERIVEWTRPYAPDRAASFAFRLSNEQRLIERALEKPTFGWGIWGRSRVFDERGVDLSVTDGVWIIVLGERGWIGFIAHFGILVLPIFCLLWRSRQQMPSSEIAGIALIMGGNFLYLIPNSTLSPVGLLMIGVVVASLRQKENALHVIEDANEESDEFRLATSQYTRFAGKRSSRPMHQRAKVSAMEPLVGRHRQS